MATRIGDLIPDGLAERVRDEFDNLRDRAIRALPRERAKRERRGRLLAFIGGVVAGAVAAYLLDPRLARGRRANLADDGPRGKIAVNAEQGVVVLRGEVPDEGLREDLERRIRSIDGVVDVESFLHLPGEPAPSKESVRGRR